MLSPFFSKTEMRSLWSQMKNQEKGPQDPMAMVKNGHLFLSKKQKRNDFLDRKNCNI